MHPQQRFAVFQRHAEQPAHPHPEHRARPAQRNCGGHPGNVARTYRRRQRGHQRAAVGNHAFATLLFALRPQCGHQCWPQQAELQALQPYRQPNTRTQQGNQHRPAPQGTGYHFQKRLNRREHPHSPWLSHTIQPRFRSDKAVCMQSYHPACLCCYNLRC